MVFQEVGHEHSNVAGVILISPLTLISIYYEPGQ